MPRKPRRPCAFPGCPRYAEVGAYCRAHARWHERARGSAARRGYDARWRKVREMVLREQPLCADPFGIHAARGEVVLATEVDHIVPLAQGGTNERSNLQPLCKSCHARKTALEDGGFGRSQGGGGAKSLGNKSARPFRSHAHAPAKLAEFPQEGER